LLLPEVHPILFAGLLYIGAAAGLGLVAPFRRTREARLRKEDLSKLAAMTLFGGVVGPILLVVGLTRLSAVSASLLLNLEAPITVLIAVALFHDYLGSRGIGAIAAISAGSALVGLTSGDLRMTGLGVAAIVGACLAWAIDNNLAERLSLRDPVAVVWAKALGAGLCTTAIGLALSRTIPPRMVWILALGFVSYGISIVLHVRAQRELGAARQAVLFASAPFIGALASVPILGEPLKAWDIFGGLLIASGILLLFSSSHSHEHAHPDLEHDHLHFHDEHHQHEHPEPVEEPHSHPHRHRRLVHDHPHVPDLHHHHRH
jgi:drug/metabolite transporter (DMT)-like permease